MPTYRKTDSGKYEFFVEIGSDPATGKRKRKTKTFSRVKDGQQWVAEIKIKQKKGILVTAKGITFKEFCIKFIKDYAQPNLSPTTLDSYLSIIRKHLLPSFGAAKMREIKAIHIDNYINKKRKKGKLRGSGGLSERTLLHHFRLLSKILYQAQKWDIIEVNPIIKAEAPSPSKKEAKAYSKSQLKDLLDISNSSDSWIYNFILVDANTGLRISEILGLQRKNIDLDKKQLSVREVLVKKNGQGAIFKAIPKTDTSWRTIKIPDILIPIFEGIYEKQDKIKASIEGGYYKERELIFCKEDGYPYYPTTINHKFNKIKKKADIKDKELNIHSLRHTHATMLMELGWPDRAIQKRLGHYSSEITKDIYSHISADFESGLVETLDKEMATLVDHDCRERVN